MIEEFMIYARALNDWPMDYHKLVNHFPYVRCSRSKTNCSGRKKKTNMNHVSRRTKLKHRRRLK